MYHQDLKSNLYGNPHSESPASNLSTQRVDEARLAVLGYFNADPDHFDVVFTANATAAIKLVADCFRDQNFWYGFHKDAHSSIVGVREVAKAGSRCFVSDDDVEDWIDNRDEPSNSSDLMLFAYPAQSNMTGHRLPLSWSQRLRRSSSMGGNQEQVYVLLDAASYLTTGRLDLSNQEAAPDFISLSFYKIFGFPDLGALIVRKLAAKALTQRRYFGGGTVDQVTVIGSSFHAMKTNTIHDFLEDGTLPFHNILALSHAISIHKNLFGSAVAISTHTSQISAWLYHRLSSLRHFNSTAVLQFHKEASSVYGDPQTQGPILAFSVVRSNGDYIGKSHFERLAIDCGFQLRTGGVCNPGGIASMLGLSHWELRRNFTEGARCGGDIDVVGGKPTGIIRVSLGPMSTMGDVRRFAQFVEFFFVEASPPKRQHLRDTQTLRGISPVEQCSSISSQLMEDPRAYHVWDKQWCIVQSIAGHWRRLESSKAVPNLRCSLEPEPGLLRLSQTGKPDLTIDLWDRPHQNATATNTAAGIRSFDVYSNQDVYDWLSSVLGFKCTLARYRGEDARSLPEARTCMIPTCTIQFPTKDELHRHYKSHAATFLAACPFSDMRLREVTAEAQTGINAAEHGSSCPVKNIDVTVSRVETDDDLVAEKMETSMKRRAGRMAASLMKVFTRCWKTHGTG